MSDHTDDLKVVLPQALNKGGGEGGDVVDKVDKGQFWQIVWDAAPLNLYEFKSQDIRAICN